MGDEEPQQPKQSEFTGKCQTTDGSMANYRETKLEGPSAGTVRRDIFDSPTSKKIAEVVKLIHNPQHNQ